MLQIGNGGTTGSILGNVTDNAVLAFDRSDSTSFGGNISGSGVLQHNGTGTLTLSGTNSYGGGTFLDSGTLAVSSDANLGAANGGLTFNGGTLQLLAGFTSNRDVTLNVGGIVDTNGNNATWAGAVAGAGGLTKTGAGMLTLSGAGTYLGPTFVNAGTLQAGIVNAFAPGSAYTVAPGAVLDLNSFNQTIGSLAGGGSVTLGSATVSTGNDNTSTNFSGDISGVGGGLTKIGTGTFTLSGISTYSGTTNVAGGTLVVMVDYEFRSCCAVGRQAGRPGYDRRAHRPERRHGGAGSGDAIHAATSPAMPASRPARPSWSTSTAPIRTTGCMSAAARPCPVAPSTCRRAAPASLP